MEPLPKPLDADAKVDFSRDAIIVANDKETKFAVRRRGLSAFSKLFRDLSGSGIAEDEPFPLDNYHCTPEMVAKMALWINYHDDHPEIKITKVSYPLALGELKDCFEEWDLQFLETYIAPGGDMKAARDVYALGGVAVYISANILMELAAAYFSWHVRKVYEDSRKEGAPTATSVMRQKWFGLDGDFTEEEMKKILDEHPWHKDVDYVSMENQRDDAHRIALEHINPKAAAEAAQAAQALAAPAKAQGNDDEAQ